MAETGHRGGQINHPEIHDAAEILPTDPRLGLSANIELMINHVIWFVPWQTVHFFGFSLIFATAFPVSLRVLGFWKSVSFAAMHRLLPLGVFGVVMNVFSGMLILQADSPRYLNKITFVPKISSSPSALSRSFTSPWRTTSGRSARRGSAHDRQMGRRPGADLLGGGDHGRPAAAVRVEHDPTARFDQLVGPALRWSPAKAGTQGPHTQRCLSALGARLRGEERERREGRGLAHGIR